MKEEAVRKINKLGKIGFIISRIAKICLVIGFVALIVAEVVLFVLPKDLLKMSFSGGVEIEVNIAEAQKFSKLVSLNDDIEDFKNHGSLTISDDEYSVLKIDTENNLIRVSAVEEPRGDVTLVNIRMAVAFAMIILAAAYVLFGFVMKLFKAFEVCETPFEASIIDNLKKFAFGLIGLVVAEGFAGALITSTMKGMTDVSFSVNVSTVLVAIAVYGLTVIFKYGAVLQQESDETL